MRSVDTPTTRRPATVRLARWSATHPWRTIGIWLVFVAICLAIGSATNLKEMTHLDGTTGQSGRAAHIEHDAGLDDPATEDVLISATDGGKVDGGAAGRAVAAVTAAMTKLPEVASVAAPITAQDGTAVLVEVTMAGDPAHADDHVGPLLDATASVGKGFPGLRVEQAGAASVDKAVNHQVSKDLGSAADLSLPVTLVILLVAFGAIVAAGVPVLLALSAVAAATGLSTLASQFVPDSGTTSSMILLMGMAVGVDYSLFYVKRAREEHVRGLDRLDAVELAAETAGHAVVVSGLAVIVSMLGLFLAGDPAFSSLATGSIIVVAIAMLGSLTVLPAVLVALGRRIDRPRVPVLWRLSAQRRSPRLWPALLRPSLNHPGRTLAISVAGLLALALPALGMTLHSDTAASLPRAIPITHTLDRIAASFPGTQSTVDVVVKAPAGGSERVELALADLAKRLEGNGLFSTTGQSQPESVASKDNTVHVLRIDAPFDAESRQAKDGVEQLRTSLVPHTVGTLEGAQWAVGGETASNVDYDNHLADRIPWVIGFVVALTMLMIAWIFRSAALALVTAGVNLLSTGAAFGVLTLVFQHSWAQGLLDFRSTGAVINWIPLFTFAVLFGLSMDYHILVLSRIREAARQGLSTREAVRAGITRSAGTVTSAAIVMVSVFAVFASLHMVEMKEIGVGLATAVLLDALVVRIVVLPAALALLGNATWWPARPTARMSTAQADRDDQLVVSST